MPESPPNKRRKAEDEYQLIYWPGIPGRGEHIRLAFEATETPYRDVANESKDGIRFVLEEISDRNEHFPPPLAPPILKHGRVTISQVANILSYLGSRLKLAGSESDAAVQFEVSQLAMTALDGLSDEPHEVHHPIATGKYYEDQKEEAKKRAEDYLQSRLPKFLAYFDRILMRGEEKNTEKSTWLLSGPLTYADLVLFQCIDGISFAFPRRIAALKHRQEYTRVWAHHDAVAKLPAIRTYLASGRRQPYGNGIYRHYPELDPDVLNSHDHI